MEAHHEYRVKVFCAGPRKGVSQPEGVLSSISFRALRSSWESQSAGPRNTLSLPLWQAVSSARFPAWQRSLAWTLRPSAWTRKACLGTRMASGVLRKLNCDQWSPS